MWKVIKKDLYCNDPVSDGKYGDFTETLFAMVKFYGGYRIYLQIKCKKTELLNYTIG